MFPALTAFVHLPSSTLSFSNQGCGNLFQLCISSHFIIKKTLNTVNCCLLSFFTLHICNFLVFYRGTEEKIWKADYACKGKREQADRRIPQGQRALPLSKEIFSLKSRSCTKIFLCHSGSIKGSQHKELDSWEQNPTKMELVIDVMMSENLLQLCAWYRSWIQMRSECTELWLFFLPWLLHDSSEGAKTLDSTEIPK